MLRSRLVAAVTFVIGIALAGCSSTSAPSWLTPSPPSPPMQALQFESEPPGATVQSSQGQTCLTPCSLTVPVMSQSVSIAMNGFVPQSIPLTVNQPEHSLFSSPPPTLSPNPVIASLQAIPKPAVKPKRKLKPKPKVAAKTTMHAAKPPATRQPSIAAPEPAPAPAPAQDNVFPPPPPMSPSAFPPPPQTR